MRFYSWKMLYILFLTVTGIVSGITFENWIQLVELWQSFDLFENDPEVQELTWMAKPLSLMIIWKSVPRNRDKVQPLYRQKANSRLDHYILQDDAISSEANVHQYLDWPKRNVPNGVNQLQNWLLPDTFGSQARLLKCFKKRVFT